MRRAVQFSWRAAALARAAARLRVLATPPALVNAAPASMQPAGATYPSVPAPLLEIVEAEVLSPAAKTSRLPSAAVYSPVIVGAHILRAGQSLSGLGAH